MFFCNKTDENIYHIFKDCDLVINIWIIIIDNCPNSINTNLKIVDWLEHHWNNKSWYKKIYGVVLVNIFTILLAIWTRRNNITLKNDKFNTTYVLEMAKKDYL